MRGRRAAPAAVLQDQERVGLHVQVGHLSPRVDPGVGPPRDRQRGRFGQPQGLGERFLDLPWTVRLPGWRAQPEKPVPS
nr:hypothetical protein GCM10020093_087800 [Planobispora longispora]